MDSDSAVTSKFSRFARTVVLAFSGERDSGLSREELDEYLRKTKAAEESDDTITMTLTEAKRMYGAPLADILEAQARTKGPHFTTLYSTYYRIGPGWSRPE
jgi:hypothetical protein